MGYTKIFSALRVNCHEAQTCRYYNIYVIHYDTHHYNIKPTLFQCVVFAGWLPIQSLLKNLFAVGSAVSKIKQEKSELSDVSGTW